MVTKIYFKNGTTAVYEHEEKNDLNPVTNTLSISAKVDNVYFFVMIFFSAIDMFESYGSFEDLMCCLPAV